MGPASAGEDLQIDTGSIHRMGPNLHFRYRLGHEIIHARADCANNRWSAKSQGWHTPQTAATRNMMEHVCAF